MYAMLSLDLDLNTTKQQREKFNEYLKKELWIKIPKITTTWYASFKENISESGIILSTKSDVKAAAAAAGVISYDCVVNVSQSVPTSF